ncbi:uncharacterized protein F4822DRAFT_400591 [Hypoxylon trugodes]|uniref:uncharacterized protein n=1 Tax=Hypoxylon trugodes TaxID=326681 RepID=UPI00218CD303|nr:uncharacterized protein F4822DRAFT_400591 [Hypoxylon trugodes]KAI1390036.1 hypothetical protein F4822DRAFT_400591 [Hypoxylon trugodes]
MVRAYIVAPDFSTAPPPDGPVELGHILKNVFEFSPLNEGQRIDIPNRLPIDEKRGFKTTRSKILGGTFGVFAEVLAILGFGIEAHAEYKREADDVLSIDRLETLAFNPTDEYVKKSMETDGVKIYTNATKNKKPVFMITGIKIARGASLETKRSTTVGGRLKLGFSAPGMPGDIGPEAGLTKGQSVGESFEGSTDFILAIRVRQIKYKKAEIVHDVYYRGATMMDGKTGQEYELEDLGEEFAIEDLRLKCDITKMEGETGKDEIESVWIPTTCL